MRTNLEKTLIEQLESVRSCMLNLANQDDWDKMASLYDAYEEGLDVIVDVEKLLNRISGEKQSICPHGCNEKKGVVRQVAYDNVEAYGSSSFKLHCLTCGKPIRVHLVRSVGISHISASDHSADDEDF